MTDVVALIARRAQIDMTRAALIDEDQRLCAELCRWASLRAREAIRKAHIVAGASVVEERRVVGDASYRFAMGIYLGATCIYPADSVGGWTIHVRHRSVLWNGKPGRKLDTTSFSLGDPADLPNRLAVAFEVDREAGLKHPRIVRRSSLPSGMRASA